MLGRPLFPVPIPPLFLSGCSMKASRDDAKEEETTSVYYLSLFFLRLFWVDFLARPQPFLVHFCVVSFP